jgi:hypothetical protein
MNTPTLNFELLFVLAASILGGLVALAGWGAAYWLWRKGRRAEAALKLMRRRAEAPFLVPSEVKFNFLYTTSPQGQTQGCSVASGCLLSHLRSDVEKNTAPGAAVRLVVENCGKEPRRIALRLDGHSVRLEREPAVSDAHGLRYIEYPYDPAKHGQEQHLELEFETESGLQDHHTYVLKHGLRFLRRLDSL